MSRFKSPTTGRAAVVRAPQLADSPPATTAIPFLAAQREIPANAALLSAAARSDFDNPVRRFGFFCALGFLFVQLSFLHEIIGITTGIRSFLPAVFGIPSVLCVLASGGLRRTLSARAGLYMVALGIWLVLAAVGGVWPGGSFTDLTHYFETQFPTLFIVGGLVVTWKEFRWVLYSIASAGIVNELTARYLSDERTSRLQLEIVTIGNSNDFAAHLLLIVPLFWFVAVYPSVPKLLRMVVLLAIPYALYLSLSTGSRGALVAMAITYGFAVFRARGMQRLVIGVAAPATLVLLLAVLPGDTMRRLETVFTSGGDSTPEDQEAIASSQGRRDLLWLGVQYTMQHPFLGVGPGQFASYEGGAAKEKGQHGYWMVPHNSYTQVSSEAGIPALLFVLAALVSGYGQVRKILRLAKERNNVAIERCAFALMMSLVTFSSAAFFLSLAYRFYFCLLIGLTIAFASAAQNQFLKDDVQAAALNRIGDPRRF